MGLIQLDLVHCTLASVITPGVLGALCNQCEHHIRAILTDGAPCEERPLANTREWAHAAQLKRGARGRRCVPNEAALAEQHRMGIIHPADVNDAAGWRQW